MIHGSITPAPNTRSVEEQETFALALAKEMKAMQQSYETKVEELQHELRTTQKLRAESSHRLRAELEEERKRNQHIVRLPCVVRERLAVPV